MDAQLRAPFYISFAGLLWLRPRRPIIVLTACFVILYAGGMAIESTATGRSLHNDMIFEFMIGALMGTGVQRGWQPSGGLLFVAAGCALIAIEFIVPTFNNLPRLLLGGVSASLLLAGALALETKVSFPRWSVALGDASYSISLSHIFIAGAVVDRVLARLVVMPGARLAVAGAISAALIACIIVGCVIHWTVERPLLRASSRLANRLTLRADPPPLVSQS